MPDTTDTIQLMNLKLFALGGDNSFFVGLRVMHSKFFLSRNRKPLHLDSCSRRRLGEAQAILPKETMPDALVQRRRASQGNE